VYPEIAKEKYPLGYNSNCPLCGSLAEVLSDSTADKVICPSCGKFLFHADSFDVAGIGPEHPRRYLLSYQLRTISESLWTGEPNNSLFRVYSEEDLLKIAEQPDVGVQEKLHLLLRYLAKLSSQPGKETFYDVEHDYTMIQARNRGEALFYVDALTEAGWINTTRYHGHHGPIKTIPFTLTTQGWIELERISQSGRESSNAFIAMSFDPSRERFGRAIQEAITEAGYLPIRIDQIEHLNRIDDEMIARIRASKFMIADFTGHRHNVYFEAGFMLGLGRPVISLCEKTDLENLHFDTRQYAMIDYADEEDLKKRLKVRILANLGAGPHTA
jgi:hypothetical protein